MPMQIVHLIADLNGYGETRQLRLLVEQQLAAASHVQVVALAADAKVSAEFESLGCKCRVLKRRWPLDPVAAWRLSRELHNAPSDLVHTWGETALNYALTVRTQVVCPLVATLFETPRSPMSSWCRKFGGRLADQTVVPSNRVLRDCLAQGFAPKTTTVIPLSVAGAGKNGVTREQFLAELELTPESRLIAFAGPLVRSKRIAEAIWCFELVRILDERARLVIFGDGPDRHRLERYARLVTETDAVKFLGYRTDLLELLPLVDLLWQPGEETTLAGVMLEAMAAGVPVVASDVPVHREVIEDDRTGHLFPIGSRAGCARQTQRLLGDDTHAVKIATAAAIWATESFSPAAAAEAYAAIYQRR